GVVVRDGAAGPEVALVLVRPGRRWQLPKGIVEAGESPERTALREVREEAGVDAAIVAPLDTIEYWYAGDERGRRVRFHKHVHFYLMRYVAGDVADHDHEVREAAWVPLADAAARLAFPSERRVVEQAIVLLAAEGR
ncbi:MAG TPA: NUDIX hydrolase, partial [Gemmatimonadaceae bacterium]|nr:NUDIX hydrolase [Gemmatimonadaceae bacterium]